MKPPYAIGSVPSLSGHVIAHRWRSLPRVRRHKASKPQDSSERVLPWQITMDQLIFASLSHTHYWYEVGMLKVPAVCVHTCRRSTASSENCTLRLIYACDAGRPGSSEVPRNPLTRWDVSSIPANGIFLTETLKNENKMSNGWRTIKSLVHKIRLYGRRGKGAAESFSREKLRHAPQKEDG